MTKARKNHQCDVCLKLIPAGSEYTYLKLRPWDHPDNEGYGVLKAHTKPCYSALLDSADYDGWQLHEEVVEYMPPADQELVESFTSWEARND